MTVSVVLLFVSPIFKGEFLLLISKLSCISPCLRLIEPTLLDVSTVTRSFAPNSAHRNVLPPTSAPILVRFLLSSTLSFSDGCDSCSVSKTLNPDMETLVKYLCPGTCAVSDVELNISKPGGIRVIG